MSSYIVNTLNDVGDGSLRQGIEYANDNTNTKITFSVNGVILLRCNLPKIKNPTTIIGNIHENNKPLITIY